MSEISPSELELDVLEPKQNEGYLKQPIPLARDRQIIELLSHVTANNRMARFARELTDAHAQVLRVFAERMTSAAVRSDDPSLIQPALIALLLSWRAGCDIRETLLIFPLVYDAMRRLRLHDELVLESTRRLMGDELLSPFMKFLSRSEHDKSLAVMGYAPGSDADGFRYVRDW